MEIKKALLTPNPYSRPGILLRGVKAVILHWVANPMTSAQANRNFFENRKDGKTGHGSAHYIVGLDGEILQCLPETEVGYHVGSSQNDPKSGRIYTDWTREKIGLGNPNFWTIGVEMCHLDWEGNFSEKTLQSSIELVADIIKRHKLTIDNVGTHYGVVGWKDCPRLWFNKPEYFESFKMEVQKWT